MTPSKHKFKKKPVVGPKLRAMRTDYAELEFKRKELTSRFTTLAKGCEHNCLFCGMNFCPIVRDKKILKKEVMLR